MRVATGTYSGTGADNHAITGLVFQPEVVFIFRDDATATNVTMAWSCPSMSGGTIVTDMGNVASAIKSLDVAGFTLGTSVYVNASGTTYHYVAIGSDAAYLKTGTYTGNGSDNRNITGIGFQPDFVLVNRPNLSGGAAWWAGCGDSSADLCDVSYGWVANMIQSVASGSFQVGTDAWVNNNGTTYYYLCLKNSPGNILAASYTGNGSDNRNIVPADVFQPVFALVKRGSSSTKLKAAYKTNTLAGDSAWEPTTPGSAVRAANIIQALNANGFQVGTSTDVNENAITYYYLILADLTMGITIDLPVESLGTLQATSTLPVEALITTSYAVDLQIEWEGLWLAIVDSLTVLVPLDQSFLDTLTVVAAATLADFLDSLTVQSAVGGGDFMDTLRILPAGLVALHSDDVQQPYALVTRG